MHIHIETERLVLREFKENDAGMLHEICNQKYILNWMPDWETSVEELREGIKWFKKCYTNDDSKRTMLAVTLKTDGRIIGMVGVGPKEEIDNEIEIAYYVSEKFCNQGYISEAARALIEWVFKTKGFEYLIAIVELDNTASQRVVEKCDFTKMGIKMILNSGESDVKPFYYYRLYNKYI